MKDLSLIFDWKLDSCITNVSNVKKKMTQARKVDQAQKLTQIRKIVQARTAPGAFSPRPGFCSCLPTGCITKGYGKSHCPSDVIL